MNTLCLFGGGRWARVLITVLAEGCPQLKSILWVTKNGYLENIQWLNKHQIANINILDNEERAWALKPDAVIVATASHLHGNLIKQALIREIPVLSEKPFTLSMNEAEEMIHLSHKYQTPVGVNFEFVYASYLHDFAKSLSELQQVHSLDFIWHDPFCETRNGELKYGDIFTPLMHDSLQHCWSILNTLLPQTLLQIHSVSYNEDSSVLINAGAESKQVTFSLSRRATKRKRILSINNGELVLDFTLEPGLIIRSGKISQNMWKGNRPLLTAINSFLEVVATPTLDTNWPLNITNCRSVVALSECASGLLEKSMLASLDQRTPLCTQDEITRNLLIDMYMPKLVADGHYLRAHSTAEQIAFSDYVLSSIYS